MLYLHRVALNDADGSQLHISAKTGEVVRVTTTISRTLTWLGSWLHFFRPLDDIGLGEQRKDILTWSAFAACFAVLTGLWVGWQRWRPGWFGQRRYGSGQVHPYRERWPRWHFWLGLTGGGWAMLWIFSGFLANNPWHLFSHASVRPAELARYHGGGMPVGAFGGKREIMEKVAPLGPVYQAGTLSGNPVAVAAGLATLRLIQAPGFYDALAASTGSLCDGLVAAAKRHGVAFSAQSVGGMFGIYFRASCPTSYAEVMECDKGAFNRFFHAMLDAGHYLAPSAFEAGFVSAAHSADDIAETIAAVDAIFKSWR